MDTKKVTSEYRLSQWMLVIQERQGSGQSIKDFCQANGISRNAYFYWQRKLRKAACAEIAKPEETNNLVPNGWTQLTTTQQMKSMLDIEVGGCHVSVNAETDPELLKTVCRVLRSL